ncbi:MAG: sigma-70 family RNA polymerase sigma factor, partial [Solirubrobacteraceae bacterium]|nr:sigma-70 family RNA polymerase sigma factor [Solirubrobacteraceae bacterium]
RDHGRAEDITQEVFMAALRRLRSEDEREIHFRPWIYEIAKNKCIDSYRRGRNMDEVSLDAHDQVGVAEHDRLAEPGATPDAAVEGKLAFDTLRGAFGGLSPVHHDILVMREFEGLSYREIGDRLGMSRPAVESTLFRARKRLSEEYDELVSGKRCLRVQRIVDDAGLPAAGLRDQRRVARHLAHCQPCRRHAHLAGADLDLLRPVPPVAARVAAFLPLPAFLRKRWGGAEESSQLLSQQAMRPTVQWTAHVAQAVEPGMVSGWGKLAAAAATVALAGAGGAAIEHRAPVPRAPVGSAAVPAEEPAPTPRARRLTPGAPLPADAAANGEPAAAGTSAGDGSAAEPLSATDRVAPPASGESSAPGVPEIVAPRTPEGLPAPPLGAVDDAATGTLGPVLDAVGDAGRNPRLPVGGPAGDDNAGKAAPNVGDALGSVLAPAKGAAANAAPGAANAGHGPPAALGAKPLGVVGGVPENARRPDGAGPTDKGASVPPRVTESNANPTVAHSHLGG